MARSTSVAVSFFSRDLTIEKEPVPKVRLELDFGTRCYKKTVVTEDIHQIRQSLFSSLEL